MVSNVAISPSNILNDYYRQTGKSFLYQLKKKSTTATTKKTTTILTVTSMARKDTRSPGPHHECHLQFNYKFN